MVGLQRILVAPPSLMLTGGRGQSKAENRLYLLKLGRPFAAFQLGDAVVEWRILPACSPVPRIFSFNRHAASRTSAGICSTTSVALVAQSQSPADECVWNGTAFGALMALQIRLGDVPGHWQSGPLLRWFDMVNGVTSASSE